MIVATGLQISTAKLVMISLKYCLIIYYKLGKTNSCYYSHLTCGERFTELNFQQMNMSSCSPVISIVFYSVVNSPSVIATGFHQKKRPQVQSTCNKAQWGRSITDAAPCWHIVKSTTHPNSVKRTLDHRYLITFFVVTPVNNVASTCITTTS